MNGFGALLGEALRDAARRRVVVVVAAMSLLSLLAVDSCTACNVEVRGEAVPIGEVAGFTGAALLAVLSLWTMALAALLAADHLQVTLQDGSAPLVLARPVRRETFALARLGGALAVTAITGVALLGSGAVLLHLRQGLALAPAAWAALVTAAGALVLGSLTMLASLRLPGPAAIVLALGALAAIVGTDAASLAGAEFGGVLGALQQTGPGFGAALAAALAPWLAPAQVDVDGLAVALRLAGWAVAAPALLLLAFRRVEIEG